MIVIGIALFGWHLIRVNSNPNYVGYASHQVMSVNGVVVLAFGLALYFMGGRRNRTKTMTKHKDPICGMQVEESEAAGQTEHEGTIYYFCSTGCKEKFEASPDDYVDQ